MTYYIATLIIITISFWYGFRNGKKRGHIEGHQCEFIGNAIYESLSDEDKDRPL